MTESVSITLTLPGELLDAVDMAIKEGRAKSRDELTATALWRELAMLERTAIDADFAQMSQDQDYQEEALLISAEFSRSDWEALKQSESGRGQ